MSKQEIYEIELSKNIGTTSKKSSTEIVCDAMEKYHTQQSAKLKKEMYDLLNLAQCELRVMYKKVGYSSDKLLQDIDQKMINLFS